MIESYRELEDKFINERFDSARGFEILGGSKPIIISAPHSVEQIREGKPKSGEYRTGLIAIQLNKATCCHSIYKTKNNKDDANYDESSPYRDELIKYIENNGIKVLLDLHLCKPTRDFDIDIGTGKGKNIFNRSDILNIITGNLNNKYSEVMVDELFTAGYSFTVSSVVSKNANIPCFQIEINWKHVDSAEEMIDLTNVLAEIVEEIHPEL